jgi:cytochrome c oxidase subunit II
MRNMMGRSFTRAGLTFLLLTGALAVAAGRQPQTRRVIHITAERFVFTPSQIVLEPGEEVELRLKSDDTAHGFRIVGTGINVAIPKRGRKELSVIFQPKAAGRYTFECTRMCGAGHNFMRGVMIVRERTDRSGGQ